MRKATAENILELLAAQPGAYVSGQVLAQRFKVSRTFIWKQLAKLRDSGYKISSTRKKGYCLLRPVDPLLPCLITEHLRTRKLGRKIVCHPLVTSTMDVAAELIAKGEREGTVVAAESQLRGRGRRGREWNSARGTGLWLSLILEPRVSPLLASRLTLTAASAMAEAVEAVCDLSPQVKWPNDLYLNGRKLAGVLTEMSGEMDIVRYLVLGMGINVNNEAAEFPLALRGQATSIYLATGRHTDRRVLLAAFLRYFERYYSRLKKGDLQGMLAGWRQREMTLGRQVVVKRPRQQLKGVAVNLGEDGALIVRRQDGVEERVYCGDVIIDGEG